MQLSTTAFSDGDPIPGDFAFCVPAPEGHVALGGNRSPDLTWGELPDGTHSLALACHDPVVPSRGEDVNQEGREVPLDLPRVDFYHWLVVDIPPDLAGFAKGAFSEGVTPRGKDGPSGPLGTRVGVNDYTGWFEGDAEMAGSYYGYDGPCPPWNDSLIHEYHYTMYALDVAMAPIVGDFSGSDLLAAIEPHVLDSAMIWGTYTLNPRLIG